MRKQFSKKEQPDCILTLKKKKKYQSLSEENKAYCNS